MTAAPMRGRVDLGEGACVHVLVIPSWYPSPEYPLNGIFFRQQAHVLRELGYRVGVVAPVQYSLLFLPRGAAHSRRLAIEDDDGIPTYGSLSCGWLPRIPYANTFLWLRHGLRLFRRYVADHGLPDLIHAHAASQAGVLARTLKLRYGIPYVLSEHSSLYLERRIASWQVPLIRNALTDAGVRTVVSPRLGEALERYFGSASTPWTWLPNIVERRFYEAPLRGSRSSAGGFRLLHVSHLDPIKDQAGLVRAFAGAFHGLDDVELRVGGEGALRADLERLAADLGVGRQVHFLGALSRDRVLEEMQACDGFVLASRFETFSVVLVEALACGKPVIATACGGPECIVTAENGLLVPPRDIDALAGAMVTMRHRLGDYDAEAIRRDCVSRFGQEAVFARLAALYERVLAAR